MHYLSNQNQQASGPYIYQSLPYIHLQTQRSLMQFPQPQRNVLKFQSYSFSSVPVSANSQGGEFTTLMNSELRRDDKKDKFVITYTLTTSVLFFLDTSKVTKLFFCLNLIVYERYIINFLDFNFIIVAYFMPLLPFYTP